MQKAGTELNRACIGALSVLCLGACYSILAKGGAWDFQTYHHSARLVLEGRGADLYTDYIPPNRYIYAPGLAWWISLIGLFPMRAAFSLRTLAQVTAVFLVAGVWAKRMKESAPERWMLAWLAPVLLARPILYIFVYGTIDFFVFVFSFLALMSRIDAEPPR